MAYALLCAVGKADETTRPLPALVAAAVEAIRQNYMALYGVEELSEQLRVTKSHLVRAFKQALGGAARQVPHRRAHRGGEDAAAGADEYNLDHHRRPDRFSGANYPLPGVSSGRWGSPPPPGAPPRHRLPWYPSCRPRSNEMFV